MDHELEMLETTHYGVLGIPFEATERDVVSGYRRSVKRLHPDVDPDPGATERFQRARAAYETLRDPIKRVRYDATLAQSDVPGVPALADRFVSRRIEDGLLGGFISLAGVALLYALVLIVAY